MFDAALILIIIFAVVAVRIAKAVALQSPIFTEFNQPGSLRFAVFLYPLAPMALVLGTWRIGVFLTAVLAATCYIPGLMLAHRLSKGLERAGTDRVKAAREIASEAFVAALGGLLCVSVYFVIATAISFI